jgi:putative transcriptional regulator
MRASLNVIVGMGFALLLLATGGKGCADLQAADQRGAQVAIDRLATGRLLVASREVRDATFERTVVLLFARSDEGTAGLIVNRPTQLGVDRILPSLPRVGDASTRTFFGGPVALEQVRGLLHMPVSPVDGVLQVLPGLYLLPTRSTLERAADEGVASSQLRLYYGYAGWGPGQLESEIRRGDWHVIDGDISIVFDPEPETVWYRRIRTSDTIAA